MKKLCLALLIMFFWCQLGLGAGQEGAVFRSLGCGSCHKPEASKSSPSLQQVAEAYHGKENQLISYLKGEAEPIVEPSKANRMKRYIEKTKSLSDADRKALADFMLSHSSK